MKHVTLHQRVVVTLTLAGTVIVALLALLPGSLPQARGQTAGPQPTAPAGETFAGPCAFTNGQLDVLPGGTCAITFQATQGPGTYTVTVTGNATVNCPPGATNCSVSADGKTLTLTATSTNQSLTFIFTLGSGVVAETGSIDHASTGFLASRAGDTSGFVAPDDQAAPASLALSGPKGAIATVTVNAGLGVVYPAGWNLVGVPTNTAVSAAAALFTLFKPTDASYTSVAPGAPLLGAEGYWAFFFSPVTVTLPDVGPQGGTVSLPAGRFVQVGNPGSKAVALSGADSVVSFDPTGGSYVQITTLSPGQGAWAFSRAGGTLTMTATGLPAPSTARR